jgi:DNA repair protein RadA/Sms
MAKSKTIYYCTNCGYQSSKWLGKCPSCGEWNTFQEEVITKEDKRKSGSTNKTTLSKPVSIDSIKTEKDIRIDTRNKELNRVLGGGLVPGSIILVGGEPGIGKSTLLLQAALNMKRLRTLYISGEESYRQIKLRADRLKIKNENVFILNETLTSNIFKHINDLTPGLIIIDSIQTLYTDIIDTSPGSISQIRESAAELQRLAKTSNIPVILVGHITKEGSLAGPKVLEHMVDTVLQFEGDRNYGFRILRSVKNRFGSTSELGIFEMSQDGLHEIINPSEILLSQRDENVSGVAISATVEGQRPMLVETQALVSNAAFGTPQRSSTGYDARRLNMLLAVLEKKNGYRLSVKDVFMNIAGGIRVDDPAIDLAVVASIISSFTDIIIDNKTCFAGEVGLSGEIRAVSKIENRITEAEKLGFDKMIISKYNYKNIDISLFNIKVIPVTNVSELQNVLL